MLGNQPLRTIPFDTEKEYKEKRKKIVDLDMKCRFDEDILLNLEENKLNAKLSALKKALSSSYRANNFYPPAKYFYKSKGNISNNLLFGILKDMPKGGLLHIHTSSTCDPEWVVKKAMESDCYVYWSDNDSNGYIKGQLEFFEDNNVPTGFCKASDVNSEELYKLLTLNVDTDDDHVDIWGEFGKCFTRIAKFITYEPIFKEYYTHAFETLIEDNIPYVELRAGLGDGLYDLQGNSFKAQDMVDRLKTAVKEARTKKNKPFTIKLIYSGHRGSSLQNVMEQLTSAFDLKKNNSDFIVGFDLVGEEDLTYNPHKIYDKKGNLIKIENTKGNTTYYFIKDFVEINRLEEDYEIKMPLFFHDGESDWPDDTNLYDALLLDCKRIGHGFNLFRFPELEKHMIYEDINIEVCPLSNQILGYIRDMRIHPASGYLNKGIQCTISSDDPGIFGYDGVTYDYWEAVMGWDLDIKALKKLLKNNIEYSCMEGEIDDEKSEKGKAYNKWVGDWDYFVESSNVKLDKYIKSFDISAKKKYQQISYPENWNKDCWIVYEKGEWKTANAKMLEFVNARGDEDLMAGDNYACKYANEGALIAMMKDQKKILAGEICKLPDNFDGGLKMIINDDIKNNFGDNEGTIKINIVSLDYENST